MRNNAIIIILHIKVLKKLSKYFCFYKHLFSLSSHDPLFSSHNALMTLSEPRGMISSEKGRKSGTRILLEAYPVDHYNLRALSLTCLLVCQGCGSQYSHVDSQINRRSPRPSANYTRQDETHAAGARATVHGRLNSVASAFRRLRKTNNDRT